MLNGEWASISHGELFYGRKIYKDTRTSRFAWIAPMHFTASAAPQLGQREFSSTSLPTVIWTPGIQRAARTGAIQHNLQTEKQWKPQTKMYNKRIWLTRKKWIHTSWRCSAFRNTDRVRFTEFVKQTLIFTLQMAKLYVIPCVLPSHKAITWIKHPSPPKGQRFGSQIGRPLM